MFDNFVTKAYNEANGFRRMVKDDIVYNHPQINQYGQFVDLYSMNPQLAPTDWALTKMHVFSTLATCNRFLNSMIVNISELVNQLSQDYKISRKTKWQYDQKIDKINSNSSSKRYKHYRYDPVIGKDFSKTVIAAADTATQSTNSIQPNTESKQSVELQPNIENKTPPNITRSCTNYENVNNIKACKCIGEKPCSKRQCSCYKNNRYCNDKCKCFRVKNCCMHLIVSS